MNSLLHLLYNIVVIPLLALVYGVLAMLQPKVRERWSGVARCFDTLRALPSARKRVWFHAASMGEFEQLKPIIEQLRIDQPELLVVVSFSSPSGYRYQQHYKPVDAVVYLPFDALWRMRKFIRVLRPSVAVVARYDLWWNMVTVLHNNDIPILLLNATYPSSDFARSSLGRLLYRQLMNKVTEIHTVSEQDFSLFSALRSAAPIVASRDSRYDRLVMAASNADSVRANYRRESETLLSTSDNIVLLGSVWLADLDLFLDPESIALLNAHTRLLIVCHELHEEVFQRIESALGPCTRWTALQAAGDDATHDLAASRHIIVDTVGVLLQLYALCDSAYVGGGFGAGVHSVAEAACYGVAVCCGPAIERNADAQALSTLGGVRVIRDKKEAQDWLSWVQSDSAERQQAERMNAEYIQSRAGLSHEICTRISSLLQAQREARG